MIAFCCDEGKESLCAMISKKTFSVACSVLVVRRSRLYRCFSQSGRMISIPLVIYEYRICCTPTSHSVTIDTFQIVQGKGKHDPFHRASRVGVSFVSSHIFFFVVRRFAIHTSARSFFSSICDVTFPICRGPISYLS